MENRYEKNASRSQAAEKVVQYSYNGKLWLVDSAEVDLHVYLHTGLNK